MRQKEHLSVRLDQELLQRIARIAAAMRMPVSDAISLAFDALEKKEKVAERMENLEKNVDYLLDATRHLEEKMEQASVNEKERLKSLLQLLKEEMQSHDQAEQERFARIISSRTS